MQVRNLSHVQQLGRALIYCVSGCVTSAETVLITAQSKDEFLSVLGKKEHDLFVVSLSPQSRAALAAHFSLSLRDTHRALTIFFEVDLAIFIYFTTLFICFFYFNNHCFV
jgi:iron only hydrogenase large subunit-like protein